LATPTDSLAALAADFDPPEELHPLRMISPAKAAARVGFIMGVFPRARPCSRGVYNKGGVASPVSICAWPACEISEGDFAVRIPLTGLIIALAATSAPASAQDVWDEPSGIETEASYEAAIVAAGDADEPVLFTLRGTFGANFVLESGAEIGLRTSGGIDRDAPARAGFSGVTGPAQAAGDAPGAFTGLARGPADEDIGPRGRLETAYIYIDGGYGEVRAGLDEGAARRFFEGAPSLFRRMGLANPALDPTGLLMVRTDHDLTGPSLKVSYATPRILGARAGASFTPEANTSGLDRDPVRDLAGPPGPDIENALEIALNVSRRLPRSGVRLRAAAAWSGADASDLTRPGVYDRLETWSAGGSAEFSSFAFGASYLSSDNGQVGPGDYEALSGALRVTSGHYDIGLEAARASDDALRAESDTVRISVGRSVTEQVRIVGGWQRIDSRFTGNPAPLPLSTSEISDGVVIEITLSG
jgi:hypothetical protein